MAAFVKSQNQGISERSDMRETIRDQLMRFEVSPMASFRKSPLEYWRDRSAMTEKIWVKEMGNLAKIYMTPPPSSVDVERLFSSASHIITKQRNRLLPDNAERLLFVHQNIAHVNYLYKI